MTFKTGFGTVEVYRQRLEDRGTGKVTIPSARAWKTPQQVTITRGLRQSVCQAVRGESVRDSLLRIEEQADEPGLLGRETVDEIVCREGQALEAAAEERARKVLTDHPEAAALFSPAAQQASQGEDEPTEEPGEALEPPTGFDEADGIDEFERSEGPRRVDEGCVLVQPDEVKVKAQASTGRKEVWTYTAVIMTVAGTLHFVARSPTSLWLQVGACLALLGIHEGNYRLLVLADGAKWIRSWFEALELPGKAMILCWYHLKKRCGELLSLACAGRLHRRELQAALMPLLWEGQVDEAIALLLSHRHEMKSPERLDELVGYLDQRRTYLPNYRQRQSAGLWIASNRVEKFNDWAVSQRCKHSGMSWTADGVLALALLETADRNGELPQWWQEQSLPSWSAPSFQLAV